MTRRTLIPAAAVAAASIVSNRAMAITQFSYEDNTLQGWGTSFSTPAWSNLAVGTVGATDGGLAYNFNIPAGFTFGTEVLTRPAIGGGSPTEALRWDAFVASNLLLADITATGTNAPAGPTGDALRSQYVVMYPALNGRGPASGLPSLNPDGSKTYTFKAPASYFDGETGQQASNQTNFAPGYVNGTTTHTFVWDYVQSNYDFSLLTPTADDQNYTLLHWVSITDGTNSYAGKLGIDNVRVYRAKTTDPTYNGPATGGSFTAANFANGFVSGTGAISIFKKIAGVDAATINVSAPVTVGSVILNNAPSVGPGVIVFGTPTSYTFAGASTITVDNGASEASIVAVDGDNVISAPLAIQSNAVIDLVADPSPDGVAQAPATLGVSNVSLAAGKTLRKTSVGTLTINGNLSGGVGSALSVDGGKTVLAANGAHFVKVSGLSIAASAQLDVQDNAVVVDYDAAGTSPLASLTAAILSGYAGGAQTGKGIVSGGAAANRALGIIEASSITLGAGGAFAGTTADATSVLIRYTLKGDTDLNRAVNFDDLLALAQAYGLTGKTWRNGDSNYDGAVNFDDLLALAQNYGASFLTSNQIAQLGANFSADFALAQSLVPEPTTLAALAGGTMLSLRRRRR